MDNQAGRRSFQSLRDEYRRAASGAQKLGRTQDLDVIAWALLTPAGQNPGLLNRWARLEEIGLE